MKKSLLIFTSCALASMSFGQLTQANEAAIGEVESMFLCDSNATNYAATTGTGVTWDYSTLSSYAGEMRVISMLDATTAPNASDFPSSTKAFEIEGLLTNYFSSTATERTSQGFVFTEASAGSVVATWDVNEALMLTYPFAFSSASTDNYSGTVNTALTGDLDATGTISSSIDATGTINFPMGVTVSNVIRLKTVDAATANTMFGDVDIDRVQFEYYDLANSELPILIHTQITLSAPIFPEPMVSSLVLSKYSGLTIGVSENEISNLTIYPNPATDEFVVKGNFASGKVTVYSAQGQEVLSQEVSNGQSVQISELTKGLYIVKVEANGSTSVKNLSVK